MAQHDAVSVRCKRHIKLGHWAVDTINPDGWANTLEFLKLTSADFVVGQETKKPRTECKTAESAAGTAGWQASISHCLVTKASGLSAGVVVAVRNRIGMAEIGQKSIFFIKLEEAAERQWPVASSNTPIYQVLVSLHSLVA